MTAGRRSLCACRSSPSVDRQRQRSVSIRRLWRRARPRAIVRDVDLYTRRQLALLLASVLLAGVGLGIDRWRRAHPDIAERLETLDRPAAPPPERAADPATPAAPLDLNRATRGELQRLPGVGPGLAERIVEARERRGPFGSVDELRRVRGVGRATLARLRPLVAVGPAP